MHLKLLLALLIEELLFEAKFIFSWAYKCAQISRWRAFKEVADSLLSALRCPLPLNFFAGQWRSLAPTHESSSSEPSPANRIPP